MILPCRRSPEAVTSLLGPQMPLYALLHWDHWRWRGYYTHEGSGRVRARRLDRDVCGRKAGAGSGSRQLAPAVRLHPGPRELSPSSGADARAGRRQAQHLPRLQTSSSRQWPEVYDLCHIFLHVARVKQHTAILAWPCVCLTRTMCKNV